MRQLFVASGLIASTVAASAADLPVYTKAPPAIVAVYNWTGFYVGANLGYSWGDGAVDVAGTSRRQVFRTAGPDLIADSGNVGNAFGTSSNMDGWLGGIQAGYNWQSGAWVFGVEADIQLANEHGTATATVTVPAITAAPPFAGTTPAATFGLSVENRLNWFGTVRPRVGYLFTPTLLIYGTGGLAYGELESSSVLSGALIGTSGFNSRTTRVGWVIGAGGEAALDNGWSFKLEYLYMDLGRYGNGNAAFTTNQLNTPLPATNTVTTFTGSASTHFTDHILRVGVNYKFRS